MKIGINPYVPELHRESTHVTSIHLLPILEIAAEAIAKLDYMPVVIPITDIEFKEKALRGKIDRIDYVGNENLGLILDLQYMVCPNFLHNYLYGSVWGGKQFNQVLAVNTKYTYGTNAHLDLAASFVAETINDAITNAHNLNFDLFPNQMLRTAPAKVLFGLS